jgi:hypothetical protein
MVDVFSASLSSLPFLPNTLHQTGSTPLITIPGVQRRTAEVIVAEIDADMSRFPSAAHPSSWAAMCSGNHESAGKRRSGKTRRGNRWFAPHWRRPALLPAAPSTPPLERAIVACADM